VLRLEETLKKTDKIIMTSDEERCNIYLYKCKVTEPYPIEIFSFQNHVQLVTDEDWIPRLYKMLNSEVCCYLNKKYLHMVSDHANIATAVKDE